MEGEGGDEQFLRQWAGTECVFVCEREREREREKGRESCRETKTEGGAHPSEKHSRIKELRRLRLQTPTCFQADLSLL